MSGGAIRGGLARVLTVIIWGFALAAAASFALAIVGVLGLAGFEPDPFSAIFAMLLAMPWFFLVDPVSTGAAEVWSFALLLAGIILNFCILLALRWWLRRGSIVL
ncbi:hypothetical protein IMCC20628_02577 [Hoeflea sp. IMCC20628]|uniref:hypothetical protein n=1 Tax=Hoeflea sp. IMCC20628 TaxID=1620421 RepID=UPI00063AA92E|nr:hypothetical protein [Hoeflea sp. IMCC20628]AKI01275.1 hypothetical protein IMCC20628_02577 [Hoeflea sp. IMCC20628]